MLSDVYLFNPTGEMAIANGTISYQAPKHLQLFEQALAYLPAFLAQASDVLLLPYPSHKQFELFWQNRGITLPASYFTDDYLAASKKTKLPINHLKPWCWSPAMHHKLSRLKPHCSASFQEQNNSNWSALQKELYSRKSARAILSSLVSKLGSDALIEPHQLPVVCTKPDEVKAKMQQYGQLVLKAPWSSSGRGVQVLRHKALNTSIVQWIQGTVRQQGYIMLEPLLDKCIDMAFHFYAENGTIRYVGTSYFATNSNGLYQGNYIRQTPQLTPELAAFIAAESPKIIQALSVCLSQSAFQQHYTGVLGVDALVFKDAGKLKFQPCLEINLRYNMGTLALALEKKIHAKAQGQFNIYFNKQVSFKQFIAEQQALFPPQTKDGKPFCGVFPLSPATAAAFGAYMHLS